MRDWVMSDLVASRPEGTYVGCLFEAWEMLAPDMPWPDATEDARQIAKAMFFLGAKTLMDQIALDVIIGGSEVMGESLERFRLQVRDYYAGLEIAQINPRGDDG
jgi:hypothetical protein